MAEEQEREEEQEQKQETEQQPVSFRLRYKRTRRSERRSKAAQGIPKRLAASQTSTFPGTHEVAAEYLFALSEGRDLRTASLPRYFKIQMYLHSDDEEVLREVLTQIHLLGVWFDFDVVGEPSVKPGSWLIYVVAKTKAFLTAKKLGTFFTNMKAAFGLVSLIDGKFKGNPDKSRPSVALASILEAVEDVDFVTLQIGSLIVVKETDERDKVNLLVRELTTIEYDKLSKDPKILGSRETTREFLTKRRRGKKQRNPGFG